MADTHISRSTLCRLV